jgi:hypothetical protein
MRSKTRTKLGKNYELSEQKSQAPNWKLGGQQEDLDLHSHSKNTSLLHKFRICGSLSRNLKGGGNLGKDEAK